MKPLLAISFAAIFSAVLLPTLGFAQENKDDQEQSGTIVIETGRKPPEPEPLFSASSVTEATISTAEVSQKLTVDIKVIQGKPKFASLEIRGSGEITNVEGEGVKSWSVRRENGLRFLDVFLDNGIKNVQATVTATASLTDLPTSLDLLHLATGDAIGFTSTIKIDFDARVQGKIVTAEGFASLQAINGVAQLQSNTGGRITIDLALNATAPTAVELIDASLEGTLSDDEKSIAFQLNSEVVVSQPNSEITILSGNAAISSLPQNENYRLTLAGDTENPVYKLVFPSTGKFSVQLDFVAPVIAGDNGTNVVDFKVAASAIVPLTLNGFSSELTFSNPADSIVPQQRDDQWVAFLPATGRALMQWKSTQKTGEGKLFFTTSGRIEARLGSGLLRQDHVLTYQVLQGELNSLTIKLVGPGEILDVSGDKVLAWSIDEQDSQRVLNVTLSQPFTSTESIAVRSQTALGAFPVRVEGLSLQPNGSIRHSGYLRLTNLGLVRIEPVGLSGLAQLSPDQFPGEAIEARQVFVYRFPAAEHSFAVAADRIQPEVNVSELTVYQLTETDRRILADIELDIREAPIREWEFSIPDDFSVVSVTGSSVADYVVGTNPSDGLRSLTVIFSQDVQGRQLVVLNLEKSETAAAGDWQLKRVEHPNAKSVRGDIGVLGAPGFRLTVGSTDKLLEKPVSYFPKASPYLQQAFRLREPDWSATMQVELLERSVQADVFHLYSLSEQTIYGSALINYFVTGSPVSEWKLTVPQALANITVDGQDVRTWRREGDDLFVTLHQGVMGAYTLLITFEQKPDEQTGAFSAGLVSPTDVQGERGFVQIVSPLQVELTTDFISDEMLKLDALELPAEFRLLSSAPSLGTWQYTERPFRLDLRVNWFKPGSTVTQVVEFSEANSRVSKDGELVTDVLYYIKSRGERTLRVILPGDPVRLWEVSVNGQPVTARQAGEETLVPLPGGADPNVPVEVRLRLGKPASNGSLVNIQLPVVPVSVLKTQWKIAGDEKHVLVPSGGSVAPAEPTLRPTGWEWIGRQGLLMMLLISLATCIGVWATRRTGLVFVFGLLALAGAAWFSFVTAASAFSGLQGFEPIQLSLPVLAAGETLEVQVDNVDLWRVYVSWPGVGAAVVGLVLLFASLREMKRNSKAMLRATGLFLMLGGALLQRDSAPWIFSAITASIIAFLFAPAAWRALCRLAAWLNRFKKTEAAPATDEPRSDLGTATSIIGFLLLSFAIHGQGIAAEMPTFKAADRLQQDWQISQQDRRLTASGTVVINGKPGDQFALLKSPATLTRFEGDGLRLTKLQAADESVVYIVTIPLPASEVGEQANSTDEVTETENNETDKSQAVRSFEAAFEYRLDNLNPLNGIPVLTGSAAVKTITLTYDASGLEVACDAAVRIESSSTADATKATLLLGPGSANVRLKPLSRDISSEQTQFYIEASNVYIPGPGVVDGLHRFRIRTSRGQVSNLEVTVPQGLTVSTVEGPVGSWQFDADSGKLLLTIEPAQSELFDIAVNTQRGLDPLPVSLDLEPLRVVGAAGEVGLLAVAFGPEAQPEQISADNLSIVNLGDFDATILENRQAVLHRVYRYGQDAGVLHVTAGPVAPEVRVSSKQVLSFGDERIVLAINFATEITRAGLFQLSFPLPDGLEVESLTGSALHHWSELIEDGQRRIILHLNGKTLGTHEFALSLSGNTPSDIEQWTIPRFEIIQAARQTGDLIIRPTTGIRLRTVSRQNISETDPRTIGGQAQGALAFRLLQQDWSLVVGIEKLEPWITGQILHEVTLREGQTRTALHASFNVENASIRSMRVQLPISDSDVEKTLRTTGDVVGDLVRTAADSDIWEIRFKRRVVGNVEFGIEFEKRGTRENDAEQFSPASFPDVRQSTYYLAIRAGGRLELEHESLTEGWQRLDWNSVAANLRQAGNRSAPVFTLRAVSPNEPLAIRAKRHSLADALKLRIASATLTTVLSPTGDQLTAVETKIEVTQRSSLSVGLPDGGELFSIFVNGESVNSIRLDGAQPVWQFNILPGLDERTADLRFVYSVPGEGLENLVLSSPELNVPMENIQWNVVAPTGYDLVDHDGNLELTRETLQDDYDRKSYLSKVQSRRQSLAQQAEQLLEQANQLLQAGQQSKAKWAFNSVANQYALDAASNEDARVQLENLQTQQAVVGLNTRRQRLMLDNSPVDAEILTNDQVREAAAKNPILQQEELNYRPQQISQLLQGNTSEDNAVLQQIAYRLVQHQHSTEPAPQAIVISLPEGGSVYTFARSVQVAESAPLQLELSFDEKSELHGWQIALIALLVLSLGAAMAAFWIRKPEIDS